MGDCWAQCLSQVSSPLAGEGQGGGEPMHRDCVRDTEPIPNVTGPSTPTPVPSPQGGGRPDCAHRRVLMHRMGMTLRGCQRA